MKTKSKEMEDKRTISARINENLYSEVREAAAESDMSLSEWITDRISDGTDESNTLTAEEIINMDWNEKINVTDEYGLDINPDIYDNDDEFAEGICDELGLEYPLDENPGISPLLLIIPVIGFIIWLIDKVCTPKQSA